MSTFTHNLSIQFQGDDGTIIQMSNAYEIAGVLHYQDGVFVEGVSGVSDAIPGGPPPCELPQFVIASSKRYDASITLENAGTQSLAIDMKPGQVFVSPDGSSLISDTNASATTAAGPTERLTIDNSASGTMVRVTSLNTLAS